MDEQLELVDLDSLGFFFSEAPAVTAPDLTPTAGDGVQLNVKINPAGLALLKEMSRETGVPQAEIVRQGLAWLLRQWQSERRHRLALLHGLPPEQMKQAEEIFRHLPKDEIQEGETVRFDTNAKGNLLMQCEGRSYALFAGTAVRMQAKEGKVRLTFFRNKVVVEEGERCLPGGET